ncbi:MAG: DUF1553 domain-containing protein, partial [Planctomycetaceae bacterium]|nr:DUF1553 domain-containing protein [Planctomycetaceae bacterium]
SQNQWEERLRKPADWVTVRPSAIQLSQGGTADIAADGSVLVRPGDVSVDSYTVDLPLEAGDKAGSSGLAAIQLQTLPHPDLPGSGTGYGGGNFVITGIRAQLISEEPQVPVARYVRITNKGKNKILSLAEVEVFSQGGNVASRGKATQHSTAFSGPPERAIDGNSDGDYQKNSVTHTETVDDPWWELDLGRDIGIEQLVIWNRTDNGLHSRLDGLQVQLLASDRSEVKNYSSSQPPNPSVSFTEDGVRGLVFRTAFADYHQPGFEPMTVVSNAGNAEQGWAIGGATTQPHELTLVAKKPETVPHNSGLRLVIDQQSKHAKHLLGQFAVRVTGDPVAVERSQLPVDLLAVVDKPEAGRSAEDRDRLADYYRRNLAPELADQRHKLAVARKSLKEMKPATSVPILRERSDQPRVTHLQYRGNYLDLGPVVQPGLPDAFDIPDLSQQPDRMTVAKWLTDDNNPLTARVLANRIWETIFGRGIVVTSEEFGSQGELPTHPELLDWLATELYRNGWSRKELIRTIVTSSTYRQQVSVSAQKLATDPDNLWLSRGPRVRLSAEMVRDQALFVSGLLSLEQFGPPVNPPQPSLGLTAAFGSSTDWKTSQGKDRYRRALYTTWRRSNPYPSMAAFDAPNREVCTIRRNRTNTPLQSLVTLNDPVYVEAAQALARLVLQEQKSLDDQITLAFRRCLARPPRASELNTLTALFRDAREGISKQPAEALKLATDPLGALPDVVNVHDAAAMTVVCNILLNLDEIFMKR